MKTYMIDFIACIGLVVLAGCASVPRPEPEMHVSVTPGLGCEQYARRAVGLTDPVERGRAMRAYNLCQARVIELAGKYDAAGVQRVASKRERDSNNPDYVVSRDEYCLYAPSGKRLPKCFILPYRHYAPSAWRLFLRDASRVSVGAVLGYVGAAASKLWWLAL